MNVESLRLIQFRNYKNITFTFYDNCIHCFYGKNAQGKTNLIESLYFISLLHSFRTNLLTSLIMENTDLMMIEAKIESLQRKEELKVVVSDQKRHLFRYQTSIKKYSDFVGILNAVLFCPDDMMIFNASPKLRRNFIDMEIIKLSKVYTTTLSRYQKLLKDRNAALKQECVDDNLIQVYTTQMIQDEVVIILQRKQFIDLLVQKSRKLYPFFSNGEEIIDIKYQTMITEYDDIENQLKEEYKKKLWKDKQYHQTNIGIHRDDILFLLNGKPVHEVASQGQKRSFLLSIKLGLAQIIYEKSGQYPVLLLDGVFSELDEYRKRKLIQILPKNMQVFITSAEPIKREWFENRYVCFYEVNQGCVKEVK